MTAPLSAGVTAQCDNCHRWFTVKNAFGGPGLANSPPIVMRGVRAGPCPSCGSMGSVPSGAYRFVANSLELLRERDASELEQLREVLEDAKQRDFGHDQLTTAITESTPSLSVLGKLMPQSRSEIQTYILILLAALAVLIPFLESHPSTPAPSVIEIFNTINK